jgi:hypothetical protein
VQLKSIMIENGCINQFLIDGRENDIEKIYMNAIRCVISNLSIVNAKELEISIAELKGVENSKLQIINVDKLTALFIKSEHLSLSFRDCRETKLRLSDNYYTELYISKCEIKRLDIQEQNLKCLSFNGECTIKEIANDISYFQKCNELRLNELALTEESKLHFTAFAFNFINIEHFENHGAFEINSCLLNKELFIRKGYLRNTVFNNFDIYENVRVSILDSTLDETKFINFRWRNGYYLQEAWHKGLYTSENDYLFCLRESYRQLKQNYVANGNKIEALEFQKHELRIHYEITKYTSIESYVKQDKQVLKNIGNFLVLWTHKQASDFGQNIWKPIVYLLGFHFIFFNVLMYTHPNLGYGWTGSPSIEATITAWGDYFTTLIPTHLGKVRDKVSITGITDFLMRITSAYFIFYFISATRKYHQ